MKFMKLGSKPDSFQTFDNCVRCVSSELETDVIIKVEDTKFHLHKFPLLSKSNILQSLFRKASEESNDEIQLVDFPGGPKAFELCAKFCYGITVTLNAYNVIAIRCAAEYLKMTEEIDRGNLILKIEVFLNSSVLRAWKDTIIVLQTTESLLPWSEHLKIAGRCIDSIASKTSVDPSLITWSYTYNRKTTTLSEIMRTGIKSPKKSESVPKDWWIEDICELDIDLFKKVMVAIKAKGRMDGVLVGEALKTYAIRWLPYTVEELISESHILRNKSLVETIICLLPSDKGVTCCCSFLLKLLKVSISIGVDASSTEDLIDTIALKLDDASVNDLLIPARQPQETTYDIELVMQLLQKFVASQEQNCETKMAKNNANESQFVLGHGSWLKVGKLIDCYLAEVARDRNLSVDSFIKLSQAVPKSARPIHNGLYRAIDIYLKEHKNLTKLERKSLCELMDVKALTTEAAMEAAQNEQLPLRVVVQVLFFEHARAALCAAKNSSKSTNGAIQIDEKTDPDSFRDEMSKLKIKGEESQPDAKLSKKDSMNGTGPRLLPLRSRRILDNLWLVRKGAGGSVENKSSETSISSQSPTSVVHGAVKSSSIGRNRRHSIS